VSVESVDVEVKDERSAVRSEANVLVEAAVNDPPKAGYN
jgi:hypothetical protein